jgi:hypothetical protein
MAVKLVRDSSWRNPVLAELGAPRALTREASGEGLPGWQVSDEVAQQR